MIVFVYDGNPGHIWQRLLGDHVLLHRAGDRLEGGTPINGDILVCHRVQHESIRNRLRTLADAGVIVIEVGQDTAPSSPAEGNYYRRAKGVAVTDPHFTSCFQFFRDQLRLTGRNPGWHLLEGPPAPDAVFAYHLLDLFLRNDPKSTVMLPALRAAAIAEAQVIAGTNTIAPLEDIDEATQRRTFLLACS